MGIPSLSWQSLKATAFALLLKSSMGHPRSSASFHFEDTHTRCPTLSGGTYVPELSVSVPGLNSAFSVVKLPQNWSLVCVISPSVENYFALPWSVLVPRVKMPWSTGLIGLGDAILVRVNAVFIIVVDGVRVGELVL